MAWRSDLQEIRRRLAASGQEIVEGQQIRCCGSVDFYGPFGRLQFVVREVDPVFTLGLLARRRQETLAALAAAGLLERNARLDLAPAPLNIGLVTSEGSAAYHDFLSSLRQSGYGFRVVFVHAAVQGKQAEREVASALRLLGQTDLDAVALIRGGGSRADLAIFDGRVIAETIAASPLPILTGLGHEIDQSIADLTAHTALKTPTQAGEFLVQRVAAAERGLRDCRRRLARSSLDKLRDSREELGRAERGLGVARFRLWASRSRLERLVEAFPPAARRALRSHRRRLGELGWRLAAAGPRRLDWDRRRPAAVVERIAVGARSLVRERATLLDGWERLCRQLAPERTLERGFSVTRDARGRVLHGPEQVESGDRIISQLARGELASRVEGS